MSCQDHQQTHICVSFESLCSNSFLSYILLYAKRPCIKFVAGIDYIFTRGKSTFTGVLRHLSSTRGIWNANADKPRITLIIFSRLVLSSLLSTTRPSQHIDITMPPVSFLHALGRVLCLFQLGLHSYCTVQFDNQRFK